MPRVPQVPAMPLLEDTPEAVKALEMEEREDPEEEFQGDELGELAPRTPPLSTMMRRIGWLGSRLRPEELRSWLVPLALEQRPQGQ